MTNCDIIIPTYNRPAYLRRILNYYDSFGENFKIIAADSSSDENKKLNKVIISSLSNVNIQYLDHYSSEINPHHKMADVVNQAKTKYCVFCADDDFVTLEGIKQSADFLEKNLDFAVAHGRYIAFYREDDKMGKEQFYWKPAYSTNSITFSDPKSRLNHHLSDYSQPTIYGVHRTELLQMVYQEVLKSEVDPLLFGELLPSMLILIYGKMKCLDVLYAARDASLTGNWPTLKDAIEAGRYDREYAKFRDCLSIHLSQQSQLDIEESKKVVDDAMSAYMEKSYPPKSRTGFRTRMGHILDSLNLPDWANLGVRRLYSKLTRTTFREEYFRDMSPSSKDYEDFNKIHNNVLASPKTSVKVT